MSTFAVRFARITTRQLPQTTSCSRRWKSNLTKLRVSQNARQIPQMITDIHEELDYYSGITTELTAISQYYFDGQGKAIRPLLTMLMADSINQHLKMRRSENLIKKQKEIAKISEMYHTASLVHDDVIDHAETRRKKDSVNHVWLQRKSVLAGDYAVAVANKMLGHLENDEVILTMTDIIKSLVLGEFQQMTVKQDKKDRFQIYLEKTYNKTASLMANACKAVAQLACAEHLQTSGNVLEKKDYEAIAQMAFSYGKSLGMAFQLVDDWLDFAASSDQLGKPANADLKLGLATAPVLFASDQFPELEQLIERRFDRPGDVEKAFALVHKSKGLEETRFLARTYCDVAIKSIMPLVNCESKRSLQQITQNVLTRMN